MHCRPDDTGEVSEVISDSTYVGSGKLSKYNSTMAFISTGGNHTTRCIPHLLNDMSTYCYYLRFFDSCRMHSVRRILGLWVWSSLALKYCHPPRSTHAVLEVELTKTLRRAVSSALPWKGLFLEVIIVNYEPCEHMLEIKWNDTVCGTEPKQNHSWQLMSMIHSRVFPKNETVRNLLSNLLLCSRGCK